MACIIHTDNPEMCPQEHVCTCGQPMNEHHTVAMYCKCRGAIRHYFPSPETLARFPAQYPRIHDTP